MPIPSMKDVEPTKYTKDTKFKFKCHKGVKCFTQCCSKIDILLTPYDVLRMKNRLGISSEEFLEKYAYMQVDKKTSHPFAMLKMMDDPEKKCPFVTPDGCTIYTDRPANCRYYPVGQASMKKGKEKGSEHEEFFFFIREPHCLGYQEDAEWTIESWRIDQEVNLYDEMNREWKEIQLRQNLPGHGLDPNKQAQIYTAFYDLDRFKRYVFESKFLTVFDIEDKEIEQIKNDEIALMKFGINYIKHLLMLEETLKLKKKS
jgi:Fe-S-cluster containining protein